jgi:peptidoglycan/xylan/chitin deacetylase (PgdA/CDA1 family)
MTGVLKSAARFAMHRGGGLELARWRSRGGVRILMYHRFADRAALARQCAYLRDRYRPVSMADVAGWLHEGRALTPYAVAVTVDDGYRDFEEAGYPVFAAYGIPVTVFLVADFMDGRIWLWFDRVRWAFRQARGEAVSIGMPGGGELRRELRSAESREAAGAEVVSLAVGWSVEDRERLVEELPRRLGVEMPEGAPEGYQPLTWDAVRRLAAHGVEFGAHTRTHPILSGLGRERLREEIAGAQARIEAELGRPVLHFCYPNGKMRDIGAAAVEAVRAAGMRTAVTAEPGLNRAGQDAWLLHRVGADPGHTEWYFRQCVAGVSG